MRQFIARHASRITGVLSGFDRIVFRGHLRQLCYEDGLLACLGTRGVLRKDFERFAKSLTARIRHGTDELLGKLGIPSLYLDSSHVSKEECARRFAAERGTALGPVCVLSAVEPCWTWAMWRSRRREHPQEPRRRQSKCLHTYFYLLHPDLGWCHVRIQTWMPFTVQVYVNGREWLGRQLDRARKSYRRADNCFPHVADPEGAQRIFDRFLRLPWTRILDDLVVRANPALSDVLGCLGMRYSWSIHQSEWATDVMFRDRRELERLYPRFVHHAMTCLRTEDIMRFLGKRGLSAAFQGEATTDLRRARPEGVRVKHFVAGNWMKMYDKAHDVAPVRNKIPAVLRVETVLHAPEKISVPRKAHGKPNSPVRPRPLRKSLADMGRRARVCQQANERYLDGLAIVDDESKLGEIVDPVLRPGELHGRRVRPLHPWSDPDLSLLQAIVRPEFLLQGLRNRDLLPLLFDEQELADPVRRARCRSRLTHRLRILRGHGILEKIPGTHRYRVTPKGRLLATAVSASRETKLSTMNQCA